MDFIESAGLYQTAANWGSAGIEFVFAVITSASGSVPRGPGAAVLVSPFATFGTVGGGSIEARVIASAREMLVERERFRVISADLGADDDLGCGGRVTVFMWTELIDRRCAIIGAGHVAEALYPLLRATGFAVTVYDPRVERLERPGFVGATTIVGAFEGLQEKLSVIKDMDIIVMTPDHSFDLAVVRQLVKMSWRSLGIMGSSGKRDGIMSVLRREGVGEDILGRIRIPVGLSIGGETPAEIAVSIVAELVRLHANPAKVNRW